MVSRETPPPEEDAPLTRKQRFKIRHATNSLFFMGDMPADIAVMLIERGYLSDIASLSPRLRGDALVRFLRDLVERRSPNPDQHRI